MNIVYEDNHILVIYKKKDILSQKDYTDHDSIVELAKKYLKDKYNKPGNVYLALIHRLDRPVSGLMVLAKTSKAARRLSDTFRKKEVKKTYLALVHDNNLSYQGLFKDKILKDKSNSFIDKRGKDAILEYEVLKRKDNLALVKVNLITGRHHQIRLQFASRNHPIVGDFRYGNKEAGGIALFCYSLEFIHPVKKEKMKFEYISDDERKVFRGFL